jgi:hypothetical protein
MTMQSRKPGVLLRIVHGLLAIVFLFAGLMPVLPLGMLTEQTPPDLVVRLSGWGDVLGVIGRIFPEVWAILDFIRLVVAMVS